MKIIAPLLLALVGIQATLTSGISPVDTYRKLITPVFHKNSTNVQCDPRNPYRLNDGACNNLNNPTYGQAGTPFYRPETLNGFVDQRSIWVKSPGRPQPDPCGSGEWNPPEFRENTRCVSNLLQSLGQDDPYDERDLNIFMFNIGQLIIHDLVLNKLFCLATDNPCFLESAYTEPIHPPDTMFPPPEGQLPYILMNPSIVGVDEAGVAGAINFVTGWLDLSTLYGHDDYTVNGLRAFEGGRLKAYLDPNFPPPLSQTNTHPDVNWPFDPSTIFGVGDERGFANLGLGALSIVLFREHQRFAAKFQQEHLDWSDEVLFQEARKMNVAQFQHITLNEVIPTLLGSQANLIPPYRGYNPKEDGQASVSYANGVTRSGHSSIDGTFSLLDQNGTVLLNVANAGSIGGILSFGYFSANKFWTDFGIDPVLRGALRTKARKLDHHVVEELRTIIIPGLFGAGVDIVAQGIHRSRISGTLDFNTARVQWGLPSLYDNPTCNRSPAGELDSIECFLLVTSDRDLAEKARKTFRKVSNIDLEFGIMTEDKVPGSTYGPLGGRIIAEQIRRTRDADRFWYENSGVLSPSEYRWVTSQTLGDLISRNSGLSKEEVKFFAK